jgi:hypothetical protein
MTEQFEIDRTADPQRHFVETAISLGATSAATARSGSELPRLSARKLQELLDQGIVREAAPGTFYIYRRVADPGGGVAAPSARPSRTGRKRALAIAFWLLVVLVPLIFLRLSH